MTALCSVPLILFGGSVTTLGAGMAVDGWLVAEGHFLPFFPVEEWFRDTETMVEHTHRLFGVLVGLLAIATVVAGFRSGRPWLPVIGLLAVCGQGALGGFRVLESSPELAFLHGALAQGVFALLVAIAVVNSPAFSREPGGSSPGARPLASAAWLAAFAVYGQIVLGAWYRHGLRGGGVQSEVALRLALHFGGAFLVFLAIVAAIGRARVLLDGAGDASAPVRRAARRLGLLLGVQVVLGLVAWAGRGTGSVTAVEWITTILHVLCGGLLLAQTVALALWAGRLSRSPHTAPVTVGGVA